MSDSGRGEDFFVRLHHIWPSSDTQIVDTEFNDAVKASQIETDEKNGHHREENEDGHHNETNDEFGLVDAVHCRALVEVWQWRVTNAD